MKKNVHLQWPFEASTRKENGDQLLILLHGYQQTGEWFLKRLEKFSFAGEIIAPNAPFPVPLKLKDRWIMTYSWYFFDPATGEYIVEMDVALDYLRQGLLEKAVAAKDVYVVGFSQGGYIAPFLAEVLPNVRQVIGVGSRYRSEKMKSRYPFPMHNIHGSLDEQIDLDRARKCFDEVMAHGNRGDFIVLEDVGHDVTEPTLNELSRLIQA